MATPPGMWQAGGAPGSGEAPGRELELQKEISSTIEAQVARLIEQARIDTESKVKVELGAIRKHIMDMDARLDQLLAGLDAVVLGSPCVPQRWVACSASRDRGEYYQKRK